MAGEKTTTDITEESTSSPSSSGAMKTDKYYIVSSVDLNLVADALTKAAGSTVKPSSFPTGYVNAVNSITTKITYTEVSVDNLFIDRSIDSITDERATKLKDYAFAKCTSLTDASFSLVTSVGVNAFTCCTSLTDVQLPKVTSIKAGAFSNCTSLTAVVLSNTAQVCSLENINAFANSESVYIYVPSSLLDNYKADTNWSYYASKIKSL